MEEKEERAEGGKEDVRERRGTHPCVRERRATLTGEGREDR